MARVARGSRLDLRLRQERSQRTHAAGGDPAVVDGQPPQARQAARVDQAHVADSQVMDDSQLPQTRNLFVEDAQPALNHVLAPEGRDAEVVQVESLV